MTQPRSYRDDLAAPAFPDDKPIIIFDGHCVLFGFRAVCAAPSRALDTRET